MSIEIPYFGEDSMDRRVVRVLQARGIEVVTALEMDMIHQSDENHLLFATERGYTLCSFNAGDFFKLHSICLACRGKTTCWNYSCQATAIFCGGLYTSIIELNCRKVCGRDVELG